ncbi:AAA family ATPase [Jiella pacifica]|uniref:AAA family ATPase n=1 Tax=Jiella pacifica TaxID=2696469 RepID=A0A6N9T993_9HYPH|nr:AAA family ATPase [Jiella pacifica]NDW07821.1 AAA family ATPase [Jiella pacifica]
MLQEIRFIQCIGRFEEAKSLQNTRFKLCTLIFGENGWGKSTLADILRSLSTNNPSILAGRATLDVSAPQKAILHISGQNAIFQNGSWTGPCPRISVYDSAFINDNVYSGDVVSAEHLKNQYGLVVGEEGVGRVRRIVEIDGENRENNKAITDTENELKALMRSVAPPAMQLETFLALSLQPDLDDGISAHELKVQQARRAEELKAAAEPSLFPVPTEPDKFAALLHGSINEVAADAVDRVRRQIAAHQQHTSEAAMPHEKWLEAGMAFTDSEDCPFCGQQLVDRTLLEAYKDIFSAAYKQLGRDVESAVATLTRYKNGDFRQIAAKTEEQNRHQFRYWHEAGKLNAPIIEDAEAPITRMEQAAEALLGLFGEKQANLTAAIRLERTAKALADWAAGRTYFASSNASINEFRNAIRTLKNNISSADLPHLSRELQALKAKQKRYDVETCKFVSRLDDLKRRKKEISIEKVRVRKELDDHGRDITTDLGKEINNYLKRLNAGFRIDYREPDYRGKEPSASYSILIREVPVTPRSGSGEINKPCFRNTLSAGDKSTLALAFFLAKVNADPKVADLIVVLDDPFTSLDHFRREFTANEIRKLCGKALQVIILSHEKAFLRLLWDKIDQEKIASVALQAGAPGITAIAPFDIESATQPRHITERIQLEEFAEGEPHEPKYIRTRLRTVCEDFYRKGDPGLFRQASSLEEIIRLLDGAPADHVYKGALDDLRAVNEYSRGDHHAAIPGNPTEDISIEELKNFCRLTLDITRGM